MGRQHKGSIKEGEAQRSWCWASPGSILSAAVDVGAVLEEMPHDAQPAPGTGLVQGTVTRVVTMVHVTSLVFQTVQNHFLEKGRKTDEHRVISCWVNAQISLLEGKEGEEGVKTKSL